MKKKRRRFSAEFKLKVVLESLTERQTMSDLAQKHGLHPNQISKWKSDFLENAIEHMRAPSQRSNQDVDEEVRKLYEKIGRLQVENDFLKKRLI